MACTLCGNGSWVEIHGRVGKVELCDPCVDVVLEHLAITTGVDPGQLHELRHRDDEDDEP